jgi:hypothetical protein
MLISLRYSQILEGPDRLSLHADAPLLESFPCIYCQSDTAGLASNFFFLSYRW